MKTFLSFRFFSAVIIHIGNGAICSLVILNTLGAGNGEAALTTPDKPSKRMVVFFPRKVAAALVYHLPHPIKKFLGNDWLVNSLMYLSGIPKEAYIKRVSQKKTDTIWVQRFSALAVHAEVSFAAHG